MEKPIFPSIGSRNEGTEADPHCLVVMYHYVRDARPSGAEKISGLTSEEFRMQLDRLCGELVPIDWPTLYAWSQGRVYLPERCFLLTFDDGLADHVKTVLPILEERGLRGTFFVPGAILVREGMLAAHAIHLLLSTLGAPRLEEEVLRGLADRPHDRDTVVGWCASVDESAARAMYHYEPPERARLKYLLTVLLPIDMRTSILDMLFERHVGSSRRWARDWYLQWDDLVEMQSRGHTIGGHGFAHEPYLRMTPAQRHKDLRRTAAILRAGLGSEARPASYPYGSYDNDTCAACGESGFAHAFTTQGLWLTGGCDPFRLPRVDTIHVNAVLEEDLACRRM